MRLFLDPFKLVFNCVRELYPMNPNLDRVVVTFGDCAKASFTSFSVDKEQDIIILINRNLPLDVIMPILGYELASVVCGSSEPDKEKFERVRKQIMDAVGVKVQEVMDEGLDDSSIITQ